MRDKLRFSLISGIFSLIVFVAGLLSMIICILLIFKLKSLGVMGILSGELDGLMSLANMVIYIGYALMVVWPLSVLFGSLALLDASKKFE